MTEQAKPLPVDTTQTDKNWRELQQYQTARVLVITVIVAIVVLVLACLAAFTVVVSTFLAHLPL